MLSYIHIFTCVAFLLSGSGLGRDEAGIKEAIKVKLKFDQTGVGHNAADQFTFHWWDHAFNKAADNIQVKETQVNEIYPSIFISKYFTNFT